MPILLNNNPNPQAIMLGRQHLRKIMLGGEVVWQKHRPQIPTPDLSLESLDYKGIKLTAANQESNLFFPMFFPARPFDDERLYLDRLTFIKEAELSLQSIDALLEADVLKGNMLFPMYFFGLDDTPEKYDFLRKLTFIAKIDNTLDYIKDFTITAKQNLDYVNDFILSVIQISDFTKDFTVQSIQTVDYIQDFLLFAFNPDSHFTADFPINAVDLSDAASQQRTDSGRCTRLGQSAGLCGRQRYDQCNSGSH